MIKHILTLILVICSFFSHSDNIIRLKIEGGTGADEAVIYFDSNATDNYDQDLDAVKMTSASSPNIYSLSDDSVDLSINVLGKFIKDKSVPLVFDIKTNGLYVISLTEFKQADTTTMVYLEDRLQNKFYNLISITKVNFILEKSKIQNRFFIHFKLPLRITSIDETCNQNDGKIIIVNPSESFWSAKLFYSNGTTLVQSKDTILGEFEFNNLDGKTYSLILLKPSDPYTQVLSITVDSAITINPNFNGNEKVLTGQLIRFDAEQYNKNFKYEWDMGDGYVYSDTSFVEHIYLYPAIYIVRLTIVYGSCSDHSENEVVVLKDNITTTYDSKNILNIYPNPTKNHITFNFDKSYRDIEIIDLYGKKQTNFQILENSNKTIKLDVSKLEEGIYFISVLNSDLSIKKIKLLKSN
jgi:hypothetical protein